MGAGRAAEAEDLMGAVIAQAADRGEFATTSGFSGDYVNLLRKPPARGGAARRGAKG
jgi:hypothetical protein